MGKTTSAFFYLLKQAFLKTHRHLLRQLPNADTNLNGWSGDCKTSQMFQRLRGIEQWSQSKNFVFNSKETKSMLFSTRKMKQYYHICDYDLETINCNNR